MSWTYDPAKLTDASDGPLMRVRLLVGDTDSDDPQLADEEIAYLISVESNVHTAASAACDLLAAKYARQVDKKVGDLSIAASKIAEHYRQLSEELNAQGLASYSVPSAGGIEVSDRDVNQSDDTVTHSAIRRGMHDFTAPPVIPNSQ